MKSLKTHSICSKYAFPLAFLSLSFRLTISFLFAEGKHSHANVNNSLSISVQGSLAFARRLARTVPLSLEHELFPSERSPFLSALVLFGGFRSSLRLDRRHKVQLSFNMFTIIEIEHQIPTQTIIGAFARSLGGETTAKLMRKRENQYRSLFNFDFSRVIAARRRAAVTHRNEVDCSQIKSDLYPLDSAGTGNPRENRKANLFCVNKRLSH